MRAGRLFAGRLFAGLLFRDQIAPPVAEIAGGAGSGATINASDWIRRAKEPTQVSGGIEQARRARRRREEEALILLGVL